jgi:hypothetical protein
MIRKSAKRLSEKIVLKQGSRAPMAIQLMSLRSHDRLNPGEMRAYAVR